MAPKRRIIIDTDPGVDDVLALLLACCAAPDDAEILLISVTFGNVEVQDCLRNVVTLFHMIGKEQEWRRQNALPEGFENLKSFKPIVAVGADQPLQDQLMMADFFHGRDGLGGIHSSHPHFTPAESWKHMFNAPSENGFIAPASSTSAASQHSNFNHFFTPSTVPAHMEILRLLRENPADSISIVAIGPLTNLALAAAEDPEIFVKAKEVVVMGGAISVPGNITPLGEFNTHADAVAAARVFALTSPNPITTMPPTPPGPSPAGDPGTPPPPFLSSYPANISRRLNLILLPLDVTTQHNLLEADFNKLSKPLVEKGSPLAAWIAAFLPPTFRGTGSLAMHDPLAVYYPITAASGAGDDQWQVRRDVDVRVETSGQWTRGACITDGRGRVRGPADADVDITKHVSGDAGGWASERRGNRLGVVERTPVEGDGTFGELMCRKIFCLD